VPTEKLKPYESATRATPVNNKQNIKNISAAASLANENLLKTLDPKTNLNPKYRFDNFVVGSHNELAHAAAVAITQNLGTQYNPLFIYGGVGLGKTHLIQATGNTVLSLYKNKYRVYYTTSEKLTSDIVMSIRDNSIEEIKQSYKQLDLLLIDDIQFIANKEKTQEEIFHIFNALYQSNKQVVFTSDRPPKSIPGIEERLRSRFEGGMIVDISAPDFETRLAILSNKLKEYNYTLPNEILEYIAQNITNNIRELEGSLNKIIVQFKFKNKTPNLDDVKRLIDDYIKKPNQIISPQNIIKTVAIFYNLPESEIKGNSRRQDIVKARQIAMYLLREISKCSYPTIGAYFRDKDHTTVMHSCEKITKIIKQNENIAQEINTLIEKMNNSVF